MIDLGLHLLKTAIEAIPEVVREARRAANDIESSAAPDIEDQASSVMTDDPRPNDGGGDDA